jgi:hypothetical protein
MGWCAACRRSTTTVSCGTAASPGSRGGARSPRQQHTTLRS